MSRFRSNQQLIRAAHRKRRDVYVYDGYRTNGNAPKKYSQTRMRDREKEGKKRWKLN